MALERIVSKDRAEWLSVRRRLGLGGSDAAAIVGASEHSTPAQVYFKKVGIDVADVESDHAAIGRMMEEPIAQRYAQKTGREVVNAGTFTILRDPDRPWMFTTLDRIVVDRGALECKSANFAGWQIKHDWLEGPPLSYLVQAQHQMAVTGADVVDIAALVGVFGFFIFEITRDDAFIEQLIEAERRFWEENVMARRVPVLDAEEETRRLVNAQFIPDPTKILSIAPDNEDFLKWDRQRTIADNLMDEAKAMRTEADANIILQLRDFAVADLPDGSRYKRSTIKRAGYTVAETEYTELRRLKPPKAKVKK